MPNPIITATLGNIDTLNQHIQDIITKRNDIQQNLAIAQQDLAEAEKKFFNGQGLITRLFGKEQSPEELQAEMEDTKQKVENFTAQLADCVISFDELDKTVDEGQYDILLQSFTKVASSNKLWQVTTTGKINNGLPVIERKEVEFRVTNLDFIQSKYQCLYIENTTGPDVFIYPAVTVQSDMLNDITFNTIGDVTVSFNGLNFLEPSGNFPPDSKIIGYKYEKANADGSPDLRYSYNPRYPMAKYGLLKLAFKNNTDISYHVSNYEAGEEFYNAYKTALLSKETDAAQNNPSAPASQFSEEYYTLLKKINSELLAWKDDVLEDTDFIMTLGVDNLASSVKDSVGLFIMHDIYQVTKLMGSISINKNPLVVTGYMLVASGLMDDDSDGETVWKPYDTVSTLYVQGKYAKYVNIMLETGYQKSPLLLSFPKLENKGNNKLVMGKILKNCNHPLFDKYVSVLYHFANAITKADGTVTEEEEKNLKTVYGILNNPLGVTENKDKTANTKPKEAAATKVKTTKPKTEKTSTDETTIEEVVAELDGLVGLAGIKAEIKTLINFIKVQQVRAAAGLKATPVSYHMVFTGNPGTGKTTVARIVAAVYKALGILSKGQLIETDRSGLIAEYVGQTAVKVNNVVDSALDGVLFIDEAYALAGGLQGDYGKEAVATLIKRMEDERNRLVVIMAGYTTEMAIFIDTNPGFKSRVNRYFDFPDYLPEELLTIFENQCRTMDYHVTDEAKAKLAAGFTDAFNSRDKTFGNGRFVRNVFEKTLENQANRIAAIAQLTQEVLTTITVDDLPFA